MSDWRELVLGDSLELLIDNRGKNPPYVDGGVPTVSGQNVTQRGRLDLSAARMVSTETWKRWMPRPTRRGDIVMTSEAPLGRVARVGSDAPLALTQRVFGLRGADGALDTGFLYYALQTERVRAELEGRATGTTVVGIRQPALRAVRLSAPEFAEQKAIADVLGALDDKIAANEALAATAVSATDAAFRRASLSGLGRSRPVLEELIIEFGEPFSGSQFSERGAGRPLIRIRDLRTFESQVWTTETRAKEVLVMPGDVVVGMDAEFRATTWLGDVGLLNQRLLRARHARFGNAFVRELLRKPLAEVEGEKSATTVIHLNKSDLARKTVSLPPETAIAAFEALAEPLYATRVALALENRTLASTRDALLPKLMSGKLHVRDAEKIAEAAT